MQNGKNKSLTVASVLTAGLASLCCIGPLVAAVLGLGAFGGAAVFESVRPYLLAATGALLGVAFYLTYRKRPGQECADGSCAVVAPRRSQKLFLWLAAAVVAPLAAFPYYSSLVWNATASGEASTAGSVASSVTPNRVIFTVEGMTCEGCAAGLQATLERQAGVTAAEVDFGTKTARVDYDGSHVSADQLAATISEMGFAATPNRGG